MDIKEETLCRLCLDPARNEFEVIDDITREMFEVLMLKMNLKVSENPVMCEICSKTVVRSYNFKAICNGIEGTFMKKEIKFECKKEPGVDENPNACRFCMNPQAGNDVVPMDNLINKPTFRKVWPIVMSELDLNVIENFLICTYCKDDLECYFKLVENCWITEEKINTYYQQNGVNSENKINLSSVQHFSIDYMSEYSDKHVIKAEADKPTNVHFQSCTRVLKPEELHIKDEALSLNVGPDISESYNKNVITETYQCETCTFKTKYKKSLRFHELTHKDHSEVKLHECTICTFKTKHKGCLNRHMLTHKDTSEVEMHKCTHCTYETKHKNCLRKHMITHKDASEVEMYKCTMCPYETKQNVCLKAHMLCHRDTSELNMYKCATCSYETKWKGCLKSHILSHKSTDVKMYKCSACSYQTKYKNNLDKHVIIHKDSSEVEMYKCTLCIFETKQKRNLKRHMLIHKNTSEVEMYKCTLCSYETKHKVCLTRHTLLHKDPSEVKMYKCTLCTYETRRKNNLKPHMRTHKYISEKKHNESS